MSEAPEDAVRCGVFPASIARRGICGSSSSQGRVILPHVLNGLHRQPYNRKVWSRSATRRCSRPNTFGDQGQCHEAANEIHRAPAWIAGPERDGGGWQGEFTGCRRVSTLERTRRGVKENRHFGCMRARLRPERAQARAEQASPVACRLRVRPRCAQGLFLFFEDTAIHGPVGHRFRGGDHMPWRKGVRVPRLKGMWSEMKTEVSLLGDQARPPTADRAEVQVCNARRRRPDDIIHPRLWATCRAAAANSSRKNAISQRGV